jgi:hypothetical protein
MNTPILYPMETKTVPGRAVLLALTLLMAWPAITWAQSIWPALGGDRPIESVAENADIRQRLWDSLISAPQSKAIQRHGTIEKNAWGSWSVTIQKSASSFYIIFSPERDGMFRVYSQGSWIIKRSNIDGSYQQVKIFLKSDPGTFVRIYPAGSRSRMDVVAYGGVFNREAILPLTFETVLRTPFSKIRELTSDVIDWELFSPDPALYADVRVLVDKIRTHLPSLRYADDGAIDADGRNVYISTLLGQTAPAGLNCSGFAKWLVDGLVYPFTGSYLQVAMLRERMLEWRGSSFTINFEEKSDPFFGLDWARALANAAWSAFYPSRKASSPLVDDVTDTPFALRVRDAEPINGGTLYEPFSDNFNNAGFDVRGLEAMLFSLASREPGRFYLAQFNSRDKKPPYLTKFFHIAVLMPYFDTSGIFRVTVFESAAETSLDRILADRNYEFVKLVRMPSAPGFEPQSLATP